MSKRENPLYQGRDWFSYRWTIAQAFDAIERIYDLCLCATNEEKSARDDAENPLSSYLYDLSELLGCQLAIVYSDVIPSETSLAPPQLHWTCYETRQVFHEMHAMVLDFLQAKTNHVEQIVTQCLQLKEYLKKIDT